MSTEHDRGCLDVIRCTCEEREDFALHESLLAAKDAEIARLREILRRAEPWLGKLIAEGAHKNTVLPKDAERVLDMVSAALRSETHLDERSEGLRGEGNHE